MPREETPFLMGQIGEKLLDLDRQVPAAIDQTAPQRASLPPASVSGIGSENQEPSENQRQRRMQIRWRVANVLVTAILFDQWQQRIAPHR